MNARGPRSPCVSVCVLDDGDICTGCYRSAKEISDWFMATPEQRCEILRRARQRRKESETVRLL